MSTGYKSIDTLVQDLLWTVDIFSNVEEALSSYGSRMFITVFNKAGRWTYLQAVEEFLVWTLHFSNFNTVLRSVTTSRSVPYPNYLCHFYACYSS